MKTLIKKTLLVLMVAFIAVFTLGVSSKVKAADEAVATFEFGADDASKTNETNQDGSSASSYTETVGSYTLTLSNMVKVYKGSYDAKGNSCLKLGTDSAKGSFSFTVPADVTEVGILVAGYKSNSASVKVNNITTTITGRSAQGTYTEVKVDTSSNKTVSFSVSSGYRCKIDAIVFYVAAPSTEPSLSISGDSDVMVNKTLTLTSTTVNTTSEVVWSSSNDTIATVANGVVTPLKMGNVTITAKLADDKTVFASHSIKVYPNNENEITLEQAIAIAEFAGSSYSPYDYTVSGTVTGLYNSTYGNFYITDGTNQICVYGLYSADGSVRYDAMDVKPVDGTNIKITGPLGQYNSANQFKSAKLIEIIEDSQDLATIKDSLNQVKAYMSLAYKYTRDQQEAETISSAKMSYSETTTTNLVANENNAAIMNLDENLFIVTSAKNKASNEVGLNKDGTIRLYAHDETQQGTSLTIATKNGQKISNIEVVFGSKCGNITVNGESVTAEASSTISYDVNNTSVTIQNVTSTNVQVWISSITINLEASNEVNMVDIFSDVDFRIKCGVDKALADIKGVDSYGIKVSTSEKSLPLASTGNDDLRLFTVVSLGDALTKAERLDIVFTVQAYVVYDGVTYVSDLTKSYSVREMVEEYYANPETTELVASLYNLITK